MIFSKTPSLRACFSTIEAIRARQIFDSRGNPTVEADVVTKDGIFRAAVPSGASTGKYEALELRDGDKSAYMGKGVSKAVQNVNSTISQALKGKSTLNQTEIDEYMVRQLDGSKNEFGWSKNKLGANAILAVSLAVARAGAAAKRLPLYHHIANISGRSNNNGKYILPCPSFNVINGGKHGGNGLAMQEFMILPTGAKSFTEAMKAGSEVYHHLMKIIKKKHGLAATNVGDEGGFAPNVDDGDQALELLTEAIKVSGHQQIIEIGMDCAASEFFNETSKKYDMHFKDEAKSKSIAHITSAALNDLYAKYASKYPIVSIEDPFDQDDWKGWCAITQGIGSKIQIVGDDLLVTNINRISDAITKKACNALLLKVNQIGSLTESIEAANKSKDQKWGVMVSHRSGETEDNFIADLVVGLGTGQIKTGAPCRSERLAKYNQLLRIEEELGKNAIYAGKNFRYPYAMLG
jgi:enolase